VKRLLPQSPSVEYDEFCYPLQSNAAMGCNVMLPPSAMDAATDRLNLQSSIHAEGVPQCYSASKRRSARDPSGVVRRTRNVTQTHL
jgi:hypothetical protein